MDACQFHPFIGTASEHLLLTFDYSFPNKHLYHSSHICIRSDIPDFADWITSGRVAELNQVVGEIGENTARTSRLAAQIRCWKRRPCNNNILLLFNLVTVSNG